MPAVVDFFASEVDVNERVLLRGLYDMNHAEAGT